MIRKIDTRKLVLAAVFCAAVIALSGFYIPVGPSKCFPIAHLINVLSAIVLGPVYGVCIAFVTSLLRFLMGTGTIFAFPGSMVGALICAMVFRYTKNIWLTFLGELFGTGFVGSFFAFLIARYLLGADAAVFGFTVAFFISSLGGVIAAAVIVLAMRRIPALTQYFPENKKRIKDD